MRFDLTDLRLFLNVHEAGTITRGAERSHMTLASASERIRGMEESLGLPLLLRERRGVQATPAGRTLLHHARLMLQQMEQLQMELGGYGAGLTGHVRLLCNTSALSEHLPQVLGAFLSQHPGISIDLEERASSEIVDALRSEAGAMRWRRAARSIWPISWISRLSAWSKAAPCRHMSRSMRGVWAVGLTTASGCAAWKRYADWWARA